MSHTHEEILKALESSNLATGGLLNPAQSDEFIRLVKSFSTMLPRTRFVRMRQRDMEVAKMWVNEPISAGVGEGEASSNLVRPKFNQIELHASKLHSGWAITTETLQNNIEGDRIEDTIMDAMTRRIATDAEQLSISGDDTLTGTTSTANLLKVLDGWDKITDSAHTVDAAGAAVSQGLFRQCLDSMPKQYRRDPNIMWIVSDGVALDWMDTNANRADSIGVRSLENGLVVGPFGKPLMTVPLIPDDLLISTGAALPAEVFAGELGPYEVPAGSSLTLTVDGTGPTAIPITAGTIEEVVVAKLINDVFPGTASVTPDGSLKLTGATIGAGGSITIGAASTPALLAVLGLTAGTTTGVAAGANSVRDGSFIWLCNPMNFIWGMLDQVRMYAAFNQKNDQIEMDAYWQMAVNVENIDAIVKAVNVRRAA
jgi:limonene-1,2-epoxide hydrolase